MKACCGVASVDREVQESIIRLRPSLGRRADRLWALYLASEPDERRELETTVRLLDLQSNHTVPGAVHAPVPPAEPGILAGRFRLGVLTYPGTAPAPVGLSEDELIQHLAIFGRSGSGKTNTVFHLLQSLLDNRVPFLIFDWKRNYRDMLAASWVPDGSVTAFTAGRDLAPIRINPLRPPPGTSPRNWLKKIIEIISHAYFLGEGVMYLLQQAIDHCYREAGVYEGSERYPTFHDVHHHLLTRKTTGREANWLASTLRTTGSLTFGAMADAVCSEHPDDISELLTKNVVLELDALPDSDKVFLVESLLLYIHHLRLAEPGRETLKHVLVVEEAHHVFLRSKQEATGGEPITDVILREIRELGEAVVLIDQHPSQIAMTALGNTYCTVAMNLKHRADISTVGDACLLDTDQRELLGHLPVGAAVVKLQGRWSFPFAIKVPKITVHKGSVSDDLVHRHHTQTTAATRRAAITRSGQNSVRPQQRKPIPEIPQPPKQDRTAGDALRLLQHIAEVGELGVTERYRSLGLSRRRGTELKRSLLAEGLVTEQHAALPGGRVTLLELTARGWERLGCPPPSGRAGGALHRFWMHRIAAALQDRGWAVVREHPVGGGAAVDIWAERGNRSLAVEVECSGRRLDATLSKLSRINTTTALIACSDNALRDKARETVTANGLEPRVKVEHVWSLLTRP